ncbi:hypothetical protein [Aquiflexum sp.]|uniref:hypothetical protein n=1 Tax=Aquiflexum sp. TaxID=1872584 RepID=UPI0035931CFC
MYHFRKILPLFSHLSLALMLSILTNGVLFFHTHELENGKIITHAHPILTEEQEEMPDHGHTEMELIILDLIAHADYFVYQLNLEIPENEAVDQSFNPGFISHEFLTSIQIGFDLRGPPSFA